MTNNEITKIKQVFLIMFFSSFILPNHVRSKAGKATWSAQNQRQEQVMGDGWRRNFDVLADQERVVV